MIHIGTYLILMDVIDVKCVNSDWTLLIIIL